MATLNLTARIAPRSPLAQRSGAGVRVTTAGAMTRHDLDYRTLTPGTGLVLDTALLAVQDPVSGLVYRIPLAALLTPALASQFLLAKLDQLPPLPADPAQYPLEGGLFREGGPEGYRPVRIYPADYDGSGPLPEGATGLPGTLLSVLDDLPVLPNPILPGTSGLFREGDRNGYRLTRIYPGSV